MDRYENIGQQSEMHIAFFIREDLSQQGKIIFFRCRFLSGTQYMTIGNDVGIWNHARVEILDEVNGIKFSPKVIIGNHVSIRQNLHLACAESIVV